jgi:hypothetical protein
MSMMSMSLILWFETAKPIGRIGTKIAAVKILPHPANFAGHGTRVEGEGIPYSIAFCCRDGTAVNRDGLAVVEHAARVVDLECCHTVVYLLDYMPWRWSVRVVTAEFSAAKQFYRDPEILMVMTRLAREPRDQQHRHRHRDAQGVGGIHRGAAKKTLAANSQKNSGKIQGKFRENSGVLWVAVKQRSKVILGFHL